jgi:hypothetical protein
MVDDAREAKGRSILDQVVSPEAKPDPAPTPQQADTPEPQDFEAQQPQRIDTPVEQSLVDTESATQVEEPGPVKLTELAEKAGVKVEEIYAAVDRNGMTVSELSDGARDLRDLKQRRHEFEEQQTRFRVERAQAQQDIEDLVSMVQQGGAHITPQLQDQLKMQRAQQLEREQQLLLSAVPEWRDPLVKQSDVNTMVDHVAKFGMSGADLGLITDHRLLLYMRHQALSAQRLQEILDEEEKKRKARGVKAQQTGRPTAAPRQPVSPADFVRAGELMQRNVS